jgi:alkyldihydroxyacetonephosphate synthase
MHAGSQERWRQFYGWGYEGDEVSPQEVVEFEKAWTRRLPGFTAVPFPTEDSINLRPSRVKVPASLQAICTTDKYNRLYHTYGAPSVDVAYAVRGEFRNATIP